MMKHIKTLFLIITALFSQSLLAQQGPVIGCAECDATNNKAVPVSGNWYNPEQSGTGYILDVKKGQVVGIYFGYDEQGKALWLWFMGALQASEDENVVWTLEAPLVKYSGGNAFNQAYQSPTQVQATGDMIKLDFHFAHYASVQINNGSVQHLIPLNYGVEAEKEYEETDHLFPNLEGIWTFSLKEGASGHQVWDKGNGLYISEKSIIDYGRSLPSNDKLTPIPPGGGKYLSYRISNSFNQEYFGRLLCKNPINADNQKKLTCNIYIEMIESGDFDGEITMAPANIGPNYIYAENEDYKFEAFRVNYFELEEN